MVFSSADGVLIDGAAGGSSWGWAWPEEFELVPELEPLLPEIAGARAGAGEVLESVFLATSLFSLRSRFPIG